jgi:hypothetical protein
MSYILPTAYHHAHAIHNFTKRARVPKLNIRTCAHILAPCMVQHDPQVLSCVDDSATSQNSIFEHVRTFSTHAWYSMIPRCCRAWITVSMMMSCDEYVVCKLYQPFITMSIPCTCSQNVRTSQNSIFEHVHTFSSMHGTA